MPFTDMKINSLETRLQEARINMRASWIVQDMTQFDRWAQEARILSGWLKKLYSMEE